MATLTWIDRKGAGHSECGDVRRLAKKLETIRCNATLRNDADEIIGACEPGEGRCDDRRIKWFWWYDRTAF